MTAAEMWRWDQGRLTYFTFDNIYLLAKAIVSLDGIKIEKSQDPLREELEKQTGLKFLPKKENYALLRNYGRVFETALLATTDEKRVFLATNLCKSIANNEITSDDYYAHIIRSLFFPFIPTKEYGKTDTYSFYFCAVVKLLIARYELPAQETSLSLNDIIEYIIANDCTGKEDISYYKNLTRKSIKIPKERERQIRESLIVICQFNFLKWIKDRIHLDILKGDSESIDAIKTICEPNLPILDDLTRSEKILKISQISTLESQINTTRRALGDILFIEGKRTRVTHLRVERSQALRSALFKTLPQPFKCNFCDCIPKNKYPWIDNILEIHHLMPLASNIYIDNKGTSLDDIVPICPNCHRSIHAYYRQWLNNTQQEDFVSKNEAKTVYENAKNEVIL